MELKEEAAEAEPLQAKQADFRAVIKGVASLHAGFRCAGLTGQIAILVDFDDFATIASMRELYSQLVSDPHWARNGLQIAGVSVRLDLPASKPGR